jgi:hypothetical protein
MNARADFVIVDAAADGRYELRRGDELIGSADYVLQGDTITVPHVETLPEHRGHRYSEILMAGIVADARTRSLRIEPLCPHLARYLRERPDTADVTRS